MRKMVLKVSFFSLAVIFAIALSGVAQGMEFADGRVTLNGFLKNQTGYRFGFYGSERDSGISMFRNTLQLEVEAEVADGVSLFGIFRGVRESAYHIEDSAVEAGNFDDDELNENEFREYYLAWQATDRIWLKLGKQQVVWGDLGGLGLRVMDIMNPLDLRWHYSLENFEDIRKPLHMFNVIFSIPEVNSNIQFVWVPGIDDPWERVNSIYTNPGHRWGLNQVPAGSLFGPPAYMTMDGSWFNGDGRAPGWGPGTFIPGMPEDDEADPPGITRELSDGAFGIRWQQTVGGFTYALMETYTHNHNPTVYWSGSPLLGAAPNIKHFRQNILGLSFNWYEEWTKAVIRGEIGHFHNVPYTSDKRLMIGAVPNADFYHLEREDTIKFGFGFDRNFFFDWLNPTRSVISQFQVIGTYIMDHDDDFITPGYNTKVKELDLMFTVFLNWGWANDRVQINLYPAYNFDREWGMLQAWIDYRPQVFGGNFRITPKVNLFHGDDPYTGDFGLVRGNSEGLLELTYEW